MPAGLSSPFFHRAKLESSFLICFCFGQFPGRIRAGFAESDSRVGNQRSPAQHLPTQVLRGLGQIRNRRSGDRQSDYPTESNPIGNTHFPLRGDHWLVRSIAFNNVAA